MLIVGCDFHPEYRPTLTLDLAKAKPLLLDAYEPPTIAELAPVIEGKPDVTRLTEISLQALVERFRTQKIISSAAGEIYEQMRMTWKGSREYLLAQVIRLVSDTSRATNSGLTLRYSIKKTGGDGSSSL